MGKFRIKQKVTINNQRYIDGKNDTGIIIGIEYSLPFIAYTLQDGIRRALNGEPRYKVAYERHTNKKTQAEWFCGKDLI